MCIGNGIGWGPVGQARGKVVNRYIFLQGLYSFRCIRLEHCDMQIGLDYYYDILEWYPHM
jgi:hypothetical protein